MYMYIYMLNDQYGRCRYIIFPLRVQVTQSTLCRRVIEIGAVLEKTMHCNIFKDSNEIKMITTEMDGKKMISLLCSLKQSSTIDRPPVIGQSRQLLHTQASGEPHAQQRCLLILSTFPNMMSLSSFFLFFFYFSKF